MSETPKGMIGIFTNKHGTVVAADADFSQETTSTRPLRASQKERVSRLLARKVVAHYASQLLQEALDAEDCEQIMYKMVDKGATVTIFPIGHDNA